MLSKASPLANSRGKVFFTKGNNGVAKLVPYRNKILSKEAKEKQFGYIPLWSFMNSMLLEVERKDFQESSLKSIEEAIRHDANGGGTYNIEEDAQLTAALDGIFKNAETLVINKIDKLSIDIKRWQPLVAKRELLEDSRFKEEVVVKQFTDEETKQLKKYDAIPSYLRCQAVEISNGMSGAKLLENMRKTQNLVEYGGPDNRLSNYNKEQESREARKEENIKYIKDKIMPLAMCREYIRRSDLKAQATHLKNKEAKLLDIPEEFRALQTSSNPEAVVSSDWEAEKNELNDVEKAGLVMFDALPEIRNDSNFNEQLAAFNEAVSDKVNFPSKPGAGGGLYKKYVALAAKVELSIGEEPEASETGGPNVIHNDEAKVSLQDSGVKEVDSTEAGSSEVQDWRVSGPDQANNNQEGGCWLSVIAQNIASGVSAALACVVTSIASLFGCGSAQNNSEANDQLLPDDKEPDDPEKDSGLTP